jgi:hypothetical protein
MIAREVEFKNGTMSGASLASFLCAFEVNLHT